MIWLNTQDRDLPHRDSHWKLGSMVVTALIASIFSPAMASAEVTVNAAERFQKDVQPLLAKYCYQCHGNGEKEGSVTLDEFTGGPAAAEKAELWHRVIKQLRADLMPPRDEAQPNADELLTVERWIKSDAFQFDAANPDPGRATVRRLNRVEYRNTIRDLLGVDYNTALNFPPDDSGHGFDNMADVLTMSPLLLEKYIDAAKDIVHQSVPMVSAVVPERKVESSQFKRDPVEPTKQPEPPAAEPAPATKSTEQRGQFGRSNRPTGPNMGGQREGGPLELSYYEAVTVRTKVEVPNEGDYKLRLKLRAVEQYVDNVFDLNKCQLVFSIDGDELLVKEFVRQGGQDYTFRFDRQLSSGTHELVLKVTPLSKEEQVRALRLQLEYVVFAGPNKAEFLVPPANYTRFFPRSVPQDLAERRAYATELLTSFAARAFRRPVDEETAQRLASLAEIVYSKSGKTFEAGIAEAMVAVLASPRFLFREEGFEPATGGQHPFVDEYSLASRLSYFLWSSMPDEELTQLASKGELRQKLNDQIGRMLKSERSQAFFENFTGQWLQSRDVESVQVNAFAVLAREREPDPEGDRRRDRFRVLRQKNEEELSAEEKKELDEIRSSFFGSFRRGQRFDFDGDLRKAMRRETEMLFEHIVRENRSLLELVNGDYSFLNDRLAQHYGIPDVEGSQMRLVKLPENSPRGGILTQGSVLAVTSNPDRTSPVKRGLFILENLLGMPTGAPPPNIPALEESVQEKDGVKPTLRSTLAIHRENALCSSCHNRMDPLGLALENFNALGKFREREQSQSIDASGVLATGEEFTSIQQLKQILATGHSWEIYRCATEKLLTYSIGRELNYRDVQTVDEIVEKLAASGGSSSEMFFGIINSPQFQRTRAVD